MLACGGGALVAGVECLVALLARLLGGSLLGRLLNGCGVDGWNYRDDRLGDIAGLLRNDQGDGLGDLHSGGWNGLLGGSRYGV